MWRIYSWKLADRYRDRFQGAKFSVKAKKRGRRSLRFETLESRLVLDAAPVISEVWADFELDANGEDVQLVSPLGQVVSESDLDPAQQTDSSSGTGQAAEGEGLPASWTNPQEPLDVNDDSFVTPIDVLLVINTLNSDGAHQLNAPSSSDAPPPYLDASGDGYVTAMDALLVINYLNDPHDDSGTTDIKLQGSSIAIEGSGATAVGSVATITAAGKYSISGTLTDGQVIVDTMDDGQVTLILNGANITCSHSSPIYVANADKTEITLATGTQNKITDGTSYPYATTEDPNAAIFSHDDLIISGNGSLTVDAKFNNGITSKDELTIAGGTLTVSAVNDGIKGQDSITIQAGTTITVTAGGDGLQSSNEEDLSKGVVVIEGGTLKITAGADGIQGETQVLIEGGTISVTSGGGSTSSSSTVDSTKGIKSSTDISISGGVIDVNSRDDALHCNNSLTIDGGTLTLATADDGIHADSAITINGGNVNITKCYEAIESKDITVNNGTIHLVSSDDGFNVSDGSGGGMGGPGTGGAWGGGGTIAGSLNINGGYIVVNAQGDGLDSNGNINVTGGTIIVHGPTRNDNGALDCNGTFLMSGGFLVAVGSSGMAETPDDSSTQEVLAGSYGSAQAAGTLLHVEAQDGTDILTFVPAKAYQSLVICSPLLNKGTTYDVYSGGSSTGTLADGLYSGGTYTPGTLLGSLTIS